MAVEDSPTGIHNDRSHPGLCFTACDLPCSYMQLFKQSQGEQNGSAGIQLGVLHSWRCVELAGLLLALSATGLKT